VVVGQLEHRSGLLYVDRLDVNVNVKHDSPVTATREARTWTVGELAGDLGVTTRTLRFYEAEGLIAPQRQGANRVYDTRDRTRLKLILRGRRFGMTLAEIREIVDMYDGAASSERRQLEKLLDRLAEIEADLRARQADLRRTLGEVGDVAKQCRARLAELG